MFSYVRNFFPKHPYENAFCYRWRSQLYPNQRFGELLRGCRLPNQRFGLRHKKNVPKTRDEQNPWYHPNSSRYPEALIFGYNGPPPAETTHKNFTPAAPKGKFSLHSYRKGSQPTTPTLLWRNCSLLTFIIAFHILLEL